MISPTRRAVPMSASVAVIAILLVALAGCSAGGVAQTGSGGAKPASGSAASGSAKPGSASSSSKTVDLTLIDPCLLFPKPAAEALVGAKLSDAEDAKGQDQPSCTYNPDPSSETAQATLNIGAGAESFYDIDKKQGHAFTDVPGLGDEAHLERQAIFWRVGTTWFDVNMLRLVDDDHQFDQPLTDAAKAVQAAFAK